MTRIESVFVRASIALSGANQSVFSIKLETEIDAVKKGRGKIDPVIDSELNSRNNTIAETLSQSDPKALAMYSGMLSCLRYDRAARFVGNLAYNLQTMAAISSYEEIKAKTESILKAYGSGSQEDFSKLREDLRA
jgi:hypothetical protein